jgi:hypothetical protein
MKQAALFIQDLGSDMPQLLAPLAVSLMIFVCTFASAVSGMVLRKKLPSGHLSEDSKDVIKLVLGLIATMASCSRFPRPSSSSTAFWRNMGRRQTNRAIGFVLPFRRRLTKSGRRTASGSDS